MPYQSNSIYVPACKVKDAIGGGSVAVPLARQTVAFGPGNLCFFAKADNTSHPHPKQSIDGWGQ